MIWLPRILMSTKCRSWRLEGGEAGRRRSAKSAGVAGVGPEPLAGARVDAVVQRQLQDLRQVEVAGEDVGLLAEGARPRRSRCSRRPGRPRASCPGAAAPATTASALKIDGKP